VGCVGILTHGFTVGWYESSRWDGDGQALDDAIHERSLTVNQNKAKRNSGYAGIRMVFQTIPRMLFPALSRTDF
jgi:hypothetical protein